MLLSSFILSLRVCSEFELEFKSGICRCGMLGLVLIGIDMGGMGLGFS